MKGKKNLCFMNSYICHITKKTCQNSTKIDESILYRGNLEVKGEELDLSFNWICKIVSSVIVNRDRLLINKE